MEKLLRSYDRYLTALKILQVQSTGYSPALWDSYGFQGAVENLPTEYRDGFHYWMSCGKATPKEWALIIDLKIL